MAGPLLISFLDNEPDSAEQMACKHRSEKKKSQTYLNKSQDWILTIILLASAISILFSNLYFPKKSLLTAYYLSCMLELNSWKNNQYGKTDTADQISIGMFY